MSKTKILYTIPNFKTAGSQYVLLSLYRGIDKMAFDPFICVENFPEMIPGDIPENRGLIFEWKGSKWKKVKAFVRLLKGHKIDIVHSWDYKSNYLEALACKLAGTKYVYTKKNNTWTRPWKIKSFFSNHIAYDNPKMKERFFNSFLFQNKITFIPHGVDTDIFRPLEKIPHKTFNIGCIGNIGSNKNQLFLIQALNELPEDIHLHLYGNEDREYRERIDRYVRSNSLAHRVHFYGFLDNREIPFVYKNLDLFVLASQQEGLPVSIIEAMACGVPVLSSNSGGGARYLLDPEYIFSLETPEELKKKILTFYNMQDSGRQKIGKLGRERVSRKHSAQKEVSYYEDLYNKIIGH